MENAFLAAAEPVVDVEEAGPTHMEQLLDEALEDSFPASDPISVYRFN